MKAKQEALVKEREKQLAKKEQSKELQLWVPVISAVSPPLKPEPVLGRGGRPGWLFLPLGGVCP